MWGYVVVHENRHHLRFSSFPLWKELSCADFTKNSPSATVKRPTSSSPVAEQDTTSPCPDDFRVELEQLDRLKNKPGVHHLIHHGVSVKSVHSSPFPFGPLPPASLRSSSATSRFFSPPYCYTSFFSPAFSPVLTILHLSVGCSWCSFLLMPLVDDGGEDECLEVFWSSCHISDHRVILKS